MRSLIEQGGGDLIHKTALSLHSERDHVIKLVPSTAKSLIKDVDMFDERYIQDCVDQDKLLDLNDYRSSQRSLFDTYDANSIMNGFFGWKDLNRREEGEKVSDIDDDDDIEETVRKPVKAYPKMPYCKNEQQEILDWIVKNEEFKALKGNEVWKKMEEENVGRGRTWQSLKEHFRKTLIGQIHTFRLSDEVQHNFKVAMGLKKGKIVSLGDGSKPTKKDSPVTQSRNLHGIDLSVRVLTTGFWPGQNAPPPINLPRVPAQVSQTGCCVGFVSVKYLSGLRSLQELLSGKTLWENPDLAAQCRYRRP